MTANWIDADEAKAHEAVGVALDDDAMAVLREERGSIRQSRSRFIVVFGRLIVDAACITHRPVAALSGSCLVDRGASVG